MPTEKELLHKELDEILEELGVDDYDPEANDALAALDAEVSGSEFDTPDQRSSMIAFDTEGDPEMEMMLGRLVRRRARRAIRRLINLARNHRECRDCIALVTRAVSEFRRGRYLRAIRAAVRATRCLRSCTS